MSDARTWNLLHRYVWSELVAAGVDRDTAPDVHQSVFLTLLEKHGRPRDLEQAREQLRTILESKLRACRRTRGRTLQRMGTTALETLSSVGLDVGRIVEMDEARAMVEAILKEMSEGNRRLFRWLSVDEEPTDEVAARLGLSLPTLWVKHGRARAEFTAVGRRLFPADLKGGAM